MVGSQIQFGMKPSHAELDITDPISITAGFERYKPVAVIHVAGLIDTVKAEGDPKEAERVNVVGTAHLADACARAKIPLVYFSTGMVFDGTKDSPYNESDIPHPLSVYGMTKYKGEQEVLKRSPNSLVVRTGSLFGGFEKDTKYIRRFYNSLMNGQPIRATDDRFGSPTYVPDLIAETARLLQEGATGVAHIANKGVASYLEVALRIRELTGSQVSVTGAPASEMDPKGVARGRMEGLESNRGILLRPFDVALAEYIAALTQRSKQS